LPLYRRVPPLTRVRRRAHQPLEGVWHLERSVRQRSAGCPRGRHRSRAGHSFSQRPVADLPRGGGKLLLPLQVRRVFCRHAAWRRRICAERFPPRVLVRGRHRAACDTGITAGQGPGGKAWRAVVPGVRKAARAGRAGLSLSGRNGPTAGVIPRLNLLKRPAYGRAGVAFWRHRRLATASEEAASSWGRRVVAVGKGLLPGHTGGSFRKPGDAPRPCGPGIDGEASPFHLHREWRRPKRVFACSVYIPYEWPIAQAILAEEPFRLILALPLSGWMPTYATEPTRSLAMQPQFPQARVIGIVQSSAISATLRACLDFGREIPTPKIADCTESIARFRKSGI
jgi:hypothetical protein